MIKPEWRPTPIVTGRPSPRVVEPERPSKWRGLQVLRVLGVTLVTLRLRRKQLTPEQIGTALRTAFETLGGLWIKVGQFVGMRTDLLGPEVCTIVGQLQTNVNGFPFHYVEAILDEDVGGIDHHFKSFDRAPFAAASIGQLHRAVLRLNGREVAVKIRRPYVDEILRADIRIIRRLTQFALLLRIKPSFRWNDFYDEIDRTLTEELDYRYEGVNLRRVRKNLKGHTRVYAPRTYKKVESERVLVMEFVRGVLMADAIQLMRESPTRARQWFAENGIEPHTLAKRLYWSQIRQRLVDNLVHGDLHPGNIVLLRDNRICLIDFGSCGRLDSEMHQRFFVMQKALTRCEYARFVDLMLLMPKSLPMTDLQQTKTDMMRVCKAWELRVRSKGMDFVDKSSVSLFSELAQVMGRYDIPMPWAMLRANRSTMTLDVSLRALHPQMNFFKVSGVLHDKLEREARKRTMAEAPKQIDVPRVVHMVSDALHRARQQGTYRLEYARRRARVFQAIPTKLAVMLSALLTLFSSAFQLGVIFLVALYAYQYHNAWGVPDILIPALAQIQLLSEPAWLTIGVVIVIMLRQIRVVGERFREPDVELPGTRT